jgi:hypothetical protein
MKIQKLHVTNTCFNLATEVSIFDKLKYTHLGMKGTRRGRKSARKIFEKGARSGERNARLHSEGRVQEE